ncbi:MRN complex-interacting protein isoform X1 [Dendrobium catenatum]|uniref:MRN complex-interacting protein N-terminal domain-containing protein n=1 Tax=Dendrobium catenatum TaxID=906689 RepID=A0A2I0VZ64_9ASPA|nr:MRN complex-interacting protein isoform X1 [Dendrobium catenatum]PKU68703.1 hypothetical protein MA16_Dca009766 [Dendrobium catenatum]
MPILFIAVQCVQCSTMQVKQQKKSNNKWVCAVCNQRQSVLKIHARGFLARDIRKFVQEFNLSRIKQESGDCDSFSPKSPKSDGFLTASEIGSALSFGVEPACLPKRRTDWSEYLDPVEDDIYVEEGEDRDPGILQDGKDQCVAIGNRSKSRWSEYLYKEEE